jgi:hypothetical protein
VSAGEITVIDSDKYLTGRPVAADLKCCRGWKGACARAAFSVILDVRKKKEADKKEGRIPAAGKGGPSGEPKNEEERGGGATRLFVSGRVHIITYFSASQVSPRHLNAPRMQRQNVPSAIF